MTSTTTAVSFRRSTFCGTSGCVEVAFPTEESVAVRDGKRPPAPHQVFTRKAWSTFLDALRAGEFDR
jgi:hypothetical protein